MPPPRLRDIVANGLCTGCGLCATVAPPGAVEMRLTPAGWLRPHARHPLDAATEARIRKVCPGIRIMPPAAEAAAAVHPLWGPIAGAFRAHAADPALRWRGSSGGAVSAVLAYLLESGQVDAVLQVGPGIDDPLASPAAVSRTRAEVLDRAGSRYAPAAPLAALGELLRSGRRIAVVGKPCDIAGVRNLMRHDPEAAARIPWLISFFCAGVPSRRGTEELLDRLGVAPAEVRRLRYRGHGWPGDFAVETRDGAAHRLSYARSWGEVLNRHLQFRCKICPDGTGEHADLVGADAWATADGYPDFTERDGVSALIARTGRGAALVAECVAAGILVAEPLDPAAIAPIQPYQAERKAAVLARLGAMALLGRRLPRFRGMRLGRAALTQPRIQAANFLGMLARILRGRHREPLA